MKVITFIALFLSCITGLTIFNHFSIHGSISLVYGLTAFFLTLNLLICYWELCLFACIDKITADNNHYRETYPDNKSQPAIDFVTTKMRCKDVFSASFWSHIWSTYAMFDGSYADRKTYGFAIDIGNGMSTLIPSLLLHLAFTYQFLPAQIIGIIALLFFYQVTYGTFLYWVSFLVNKRHKLISFKENMIYIVGTNVPWVIFGLIGIYASIRLVLDNNYSVFVL